MTFWCCPQSDPTWARPLPLIPCWPNDRWPGPGCPGMIISHIRTRCEWEAAVGEGGGGLRSPDWSQPLAPASATSSWDFHISGPGCLITRTLNCLNTPKLPTLPQLDSPPALRILFHVTPVVPPCWCWQWLSQFYLLFQIRGWVQTSLWAGAGGWETRSRSRRLDWADCAGYRSCSGSRAGSPGSWWRPLVPGPGHLITARHIITRSHDQHKILSSIKIVLVNTESNDFTWMFLNFLTLQMTIKCNFPQ